MSLATRTRAMRTMTANELHARAGHVRVVDVREPREYSAELGHITGSLLVPLAELEAAAQRWPREKALVFVCRSGSRSAIACGLLEKMGFESVTNLYGGMLAWHRAGLPVER